MKSLEIVAATAAIVCLFAAAIGLICYIFTAIGLYTISKRRGIKAPGLAWVPIGSVWIMGSIADHFDYVKSGELKSKRKVLLWLSIVMVVLDIVFIPLIMGVVRKLIASGIYYGSGFNDSQIADTLAPLLWVMILYMVFAALALTSTIIQYICLYKIYKSCKPGSATLLMVLSIIFSIITPFALFALRKKDEGMYPEPQPQGYYNPPYQGNPQQPGFGAQPPYVG